MLSLKAHELSPILDSISENAQELVLMMLLNAIASGGRLRDRKKSC
ncbi:MAG: hypothetical protein RMY16_24435 [Nostoc sp. DedQUE12b]|nr:hypothetical protein [Nostoc sp. DedQUE12b]MDZ8088679.1 hypothetical protein [Nostoc sp. DedQUE12b]